MAPYLKPLLPYRLKILKGESIAEAPDLEDLILRILLDNLEPMKCVVFICDEIYYDLFKKFLFEEFGIFLTYFVVSRFQENCTVFNLQMR